LAKIVEFSNFIL